nr:MAG TPA: hypothetical protein [Caudoviricetes sp.]
MISLLDRRLFSLQKKKVVFAMSKKCNKTK